MTATRPTPKPKAPTVSAREVQDHAVLYLDLWEANIALFARCPQEDAPRTPHTAAK